MFFLCFSKRVIQCEDRRSRCLFAKVTPNSIRRLVERDSRPFACYQIWNFGISRSNSRSRWARVSSGGSRRPIPFSFLHARNSIPLAITRIIAGSSAFIPFHFFIGRFPFVERRSCCLAAWAYARDQFSLLGAARLVRTLTDSHITIENERGLNA